MGNLLNKTLKRYKILSLLGSGGMGSVYKGLDTSLNREVAIKVMHEQYAMDRGFRERFLQEARAAAHLDHPGIVKVHDIDEDQGNLFIVMEFIPGDNLGQMLRQLREEKKWIVQKEGIEIVRQLAIALNYAHRHGVLHRDIKPDNVMLKQQPSNGLRYTPVITDLGLAKIASGGVVTQQGTSMGTPAYMSPEQTLGEEIDERSDVYSLGILLYELTVGRLPFPVKSLTEAIKYHTKEPPPPPRSIRPEIPEPLERIILRAIEKSPDKRFYDTALMAEAIKDMGLDVGTEIVFDETITNTISLETLYQKSLLEQRGESILEEFDQPSDLNKNKIQVLHSNAPMQTYDVNPSGMTIGRSSRMDIVIEDSKASRQHAKIEVKDGVFYVIDLNSTNGTYLSSSRLLPGIAEQWDPERTLRIGSTWFKLILAEKTEKYPKGSAQQQLRDHLSQKVNQEPHLVISSPGQGRVGVFLDTPSVDIDPGGNKAVNILLINQGSMVDHFHINISGIPESWLTSKLQPVKLMPGEQQSVILMLQVPQKPESKAGYYSVSIQVSSQAVPDEMVVVKTTLKVGIFSSFSCDFHPKKLQMKQMARLNIKNTGNSTEAFTAKFKDRGDELIFNPPTQQVNILHNQSQEICFSAQPKTRRFLGSSQAHQISIEVTSSKGETQTLPGEAISKARFSPSHIALFISFFMLFCIGGYFVWKYWDDSNRRNEQALIANAAEANQATQDKRDTATVAALTAIAAGDDDGDGLVNNEEMKIGTDPKKPDTDGDGLKDGEEVNIYGTQPRNNDTDGDSLLDGREINELGTNPRNEDTDDDGFNDNVDEFPLDPYQTPTFTRTPTFTKTSMPSFTPSPTRTITPTITLVTPTIPPPILSITGTFNNPTYDGLLLDYCHNPAGDCGDKAANAFCVYTGFDKSINWEMDSHQDGPVYKTRLIGDGSICEAHYCDSFKYIECQKETSSGDSPHDHFYIYNYPKYNGYRLDYCHKWGEGCGATAAFWWCQHNGFPQAIAFIPDEYIGRNGIQTITLGSGEICNADYCGGFQSITCIE